MLSTGSLAGARAVAYYLLAYLFGNLHRDDLPADHDDKPKVAPMRAALALLADESLFSSCAMIPTGEGMAVAVRR